MSDSAFAIGGRTYLTFFPTETTILDHPPGSYITRINNVSQNGVQKWIRAQYKDGGLYVTLNQEHTQIKEVTGEEILALI